MYLPAKFGDRRCQRNGDINSYINSSGVLFRNVDLQLQSPGYSWQKNEKKKNTGNWKALCISRKLNKQKAGGCRKVS